MKNMSSALALGLVLLSGSAHASRSGVITSELDRLELDPKLYYAQNVAHASLSIDRASRTLVLSLQQNTPCPADKACAAVIVEPIRISLPLVSEGVSDECGTVTYVASRDKRPVDGELEVITVSDHRLNQCAEPMIYPPRAMTEVVYEITSSGWGGVQNYRSTLGGTALKALVPAIDPRWTETFTLYSAPRHNVNASCNVGTALTIDHREQTATLRNFVKGTCRLFVNPDKRVYKLQPGMGNALGSHTYGEAADGRKIQIVDHRHSVLTVVFPSRLVVTETRTDGRQSTLYSFDGQL